MRRLLLTLPLLVAVLVQVEGAGGRESYREWLTFNEVRLDGHKEVLSRHDVYPERSSLSPDHRRLAYAPYVYDGARSKELWIADVHGPNRRLVVEAPGWIVDVAWAPDGRTIALSVFSSRAPEVDGIWLVKPDGSELRRQADTRYGARLAWSPDSRQLVYVHDVGLRWTMTILTVETGQVRDLGEGQFPQWSPGGGKIVYYSVLGEIRVLSVADGRSRRLARGLAPVWSPDGQRIAFIRTPQDGPASLWVVPSSGGRPKLVAARLSLSFSYPVWSPSGRTIAFVRDRRGGCRTSLNVVATTGAGKPRRLASETRIIAPLAWRGKRILYQATRCLG